ncbi:C4b-binding protein alpha chain-like isoform X2 [Hippocampus comes]|uniref:C4b-binding protein alpha chain-like isoform X2 n=1 Tax=Hippocampus comes TaxID=109280 RepID=UPI00094EB949|nr:PREDICTED: C4b-binding protein alpha chain-like isoform X2 [Hippocampus comes]
MRFIVWNILCLSISLLDTAEVPKRCSAPPQFPSTRLQNKWRTRNTFDIGEKVYYKCAEDFVAYAGSLSVMCVNGIWTALTLKCEKRSCGNVGDLPNGRFRYEGHPLIGERVYALCNDGYTLKGPKYMTCERAGWTGEFPTCEKVDTTCSTPEVANSERISGGDSIHRAGEKLTFTCSPGFLLDGPQHVTCSPSGQWEPKVPQCLTSAAHQGGCSAPENLDESHTNLADEFITRTTFAAGERVTYTCDVGYSPVGGSRYRKCISGQWTPLLLKCERKLCGSAGEIRNGRFIYTGVEFGDIATAHCDDGFQLVGRPTRNCMSFGWDGHAPFCEVVECEEPPEVANAEQNGKEEAPYKYRSVVVYECRTGNLVGNKAIWCTENGTWSTPPSCREITCPSPKVPNASWTRAHIRLYQHRDTISIDCRHGYTVVGASTVTCGDNGQWVPILPKCRRTSRHTKWQSRYAV